VRPTLWITKNSLLLASVTVNSDEVVVEADAGSVDTRLGYWNRALNSFFMRGQT